VLAQAPAALTRPVHTLRHRTGVSGRATAGTVAPTFSARPACGNCRGARPGRPVSAWQARDWTTRRSRPAKGSRRANSRWN